jgi:hypothetical protein
LRSTRDSAGMVVSRGPTPSSKSTLGEAGTVSNEAYDSCVRLCTPVPKPGAKLNRLAGTITESMSADGSCSPDFVNEEGECNDLNVGMVLLLCREVKGDGRVEFCGVLAVGWFVWFIAGRRAKRDNDESGNGEGGVTDMVYSEANK